ncbi:hypothetical protein IDJ77_14095 [Mucilaginibacter sp. ZT4R22]|uniref:Uncharacterized protein n=1 Tax=Mucilaginibacter pankratovii TaxID=2772110 RepID=A0ABR7WRK8_9SPHI|nr:hypothetical protein [Mucilaginibacter pankratovii]MBD1364949.1 hypothetical protein [Mucilaginibacter pankratovii]
MSFYQPNQINSSALCVLRKKDNGELIITYEPLVSPIPEAITQLENILRHTRQDQAKAVFETILNDDVLKIIFGPRSSFCDNLWEPWQEDNSKLRLEQIFDSKYVDKVQHLKMAILAHKLHHTYHKCRQDEGVLAYSHRLIGWKTFPHQIDANFNVEFVSNFGFGNSTFFCIKLSYKGVDILPLTHWIRYRIVNKEEIIRCTQTYNPQNENWYKAIDYVKAACNMFRQSESRFVNYYLLGECSRLVEGLKSIATKSTFEFITSGYHFVVAKETKTLSGDELIAYRADRISGSLAFIEHINSLRYIRDINAIVQEIEKLNHQIKPVIERARERLESLLELKTRRMKGFKILHYELHEENTAYYNKRQLMQKELFQQKIFSSEILDNTFAERYPEYNGFEIKYKKNSKDYCELSDEINEIERYIQQYNESLKAIKNYFDSLD